MRLLPTNFNEMISVPFMDIVVNFVEKFFNKKQIYVNDIRKELEYCPEHENELPIILLLFRLW